MKSELFPILDKIESMKHPELMPQILEKAGELGLLGLSVPQAYGGMGVDFKSSMLATEVLGGGYSFSVAYGAHTGIGTLPLLYYGNEEQKKQIYTKISQWRMESSILFN
jgi:alkylation response protein AidB-like acyl-CoA dehydrogenase